MCTKPEPTCGPGGGLDPHRSRGATWTPWASSQPSPGWAVMRTGFSPGPVPAELEQAGQRLQGAGSPAPATPGCETERLHGARPQAAQAPVSRRKGPSGGGEKVLEGQVGWQGGQEGGLCLPGLSLSSSGHPRAPTCPLPSPHSTEEQKQVTTLSMPAVPIKKGAGQSRSQRSLGVKCQTRLAHCTVTVAQSEGTGQQCGGDRVDTKQNGALSM